jgi:hypothetical protein
VIITGSVLLIVAAVFGVDLIWKNHYPIRSPALFGQTLGIHNAAELFMANYCRSHCPRCSGRLADSCPSAGRRDGERARSAGQQVIAAASPVVQPNGMGHMRR